MLGFLYTISGDIVADGVHEVGWDGHFPMGETFTEQLVVPAQLPTWLTSRRSRVLRRRARARSGFRGGLNWYRNINALPGDPGPVRRRHDRPARALPRRRARPDRRQHARGAGRHCRAAVPGLRRLEDVPGAGHWLQQERPDEVNAALVEFLSEI